MKNFYTVILFIFIAGSCTDNKTRVAAGDLSEYQTPSVLKEDSYSVELSDFRYKSVDLVEKLYTEAIAKDPQLEKLHIRTSELKSDTREALKKYQEYFEINESYHTDALMLIELISDSSMQEKLKTLLTERQNLYENSIAELKTSEEQLNLSKYHFQDQEILTKILVTLPMIASYRKNEKPADEPIRQLDKEYRSLQKAYKAYQEKLK